MGRRYRYTSGVTFSVKLIINRNSSSRLFISAVGMPPTCETSRARCRECRGNATSAESAHLCIVSVVVVDVVKKLCSHHDAALAQ